MGTVTFGPKCDKIGACRFYNIIQTGGDLAIPGVTVIKKAIEGLVKALSVTAVRCDHTVLIRGTPASLRFQVL
jgi:hypothetical protein